MRSHHPDDSIVEVDASSKALDEFSPESAPAQRLFSSTVQQARGAVRSSAAAAERGMASLYHTVANLQQRREQPEFDGVVIAILLAIVSIGYGSFLTVAWRQPVETRAVAPAQATLTSTTLDPVVVSVARVLAEPVAVTAPIGARHAAAFLSPRSLTAMWKRRDTRSLEQAFTGLRQQTLAFHRCGMRKTGDDRAVARCEGSGSTWTIDFQRQAGRWQIARVVTR
jgi:hypothetical protein